jgi:hypothetical protein
MGGPSDRAVPGIPIEQAAELIKLAAQFDDGAPADILRTYLRLHAGKLGAHWMWVALQRIAAGEGEAAVMDDYGYSRTGHAGVPPTAAQRADVIASRIESRNSAPLWRHPPQQSCLFGEARAV